MEQNGGHINMACHSEKGHGKKVENKPSSSENYTLLGRSEQARAVQ